MQFAGVAWQFKGGSPAKLKLLINMQASGQAKPLDAHF
jgi:hypothetical protein